MDHEVRVCGSEAQETPNVRKSQHTNSERQIQPEGDDKPTTTTRKARNIIELSPLKAMRLGRLSEIRSEPRAAPRKRSNSSGDGPRITPRILDTWDSARDTWDSAKEQLDATIGLRFRGLSLSPPFKGKKTIAYSSPTETANSNALRSRRRESNRRVSMSRPRSRYVIPVDHKFKVYWDIFTMIFAIAYMHKMHEEIRDRQFGVLSSPFKVFCDIWFLVDILLNFVSERRTREGELLSDYRSICAKYLTSWFAIDVLSLFPWETLYVQPIIEIQNRRHIFQKLFFRSRAVVLVFINRLRARHFRWFGTVANHTKHHGVGSARLLRLLIKYLPKYILFFRNMKGAVAMRVLRQVHWLRRFYNTTAKTDGQTESISKDEYDDDDISSNQSGDGLRQVRLVYEEWELVEDKDDGVPF